MNFAGLKKPNSGSELFHLTKASAPMILSVESSILG